MARLAFFGTPEFSLPFLQTLVRFCHSHGHEFSLVVTQGDRPQGRGKKLLSPPVKIFAQQVGIEVCQPESLRKNTDDGDQFYQRFCAKNIDLAVVVAYGKIIPERLLKQASQGFVNVHGSLLPKFRGASPVQRAIESGDKITGVCLMDMVKGLDEGDVYACRTTPILAADTAETLFFRLSRLGSSLLYDHLDDLIYGRLKKIPQSDKDACYAPMINKDDGLLNFMQPCAHISRKVQAFDPWPGSFGFINQKRVKFFDSFFIVSDELANEYAPGTVVAVSDFLGIKAQDGIVYFKSMQLEGKRVMPIKHALLGFAIKRGDRIVSKL